MKKFITHLLTAIALITGTFTVGKAIHRHDQIQKVEQLQFNYNLCKMVVAVWTEQGREFNNNCDEMLGEIAEARVKYNVPAE